MGVILGTAAYMPPEQAKGKSVDKRADIWAFGVVLYEMIAGKRPFEGETVSDLFASVIAKEPDFQTIPEPPRSIVEKCLRKDPRRRWRDIGDVRMALDENPAPASAPAQSRSNALAFAVAAVFAAVALVTSIALWRATRPVDHLPERFDLPFSTEAAVYNAPALSPDGTKIAYLGRLADRNLGLHVRRLDQPSSAPLQGTGDAAYPFFSPAGDWIGYSADGALYKIQTGGGLPIHLTDVSDFRGGSWGDDGNIVYASSNGPLLQIPATGGKPEPVTQLGAGESTHRWPQVLPGSDLILFSEAKSSNFLHATAQIWSRKAHRAKILADNALYPRYAASGHLLFLRDNQLYAAPMSLSRMELTAAAAPILENVGDDLLRGTGAFAVSQSGTLAALTLKGNSPGMGMFTLEADGKTELMDPVFGVEMRLNRAGDRVAFITAGATSRIVISEPGLRQSSAHDFAPDPPFLPTWHPDGRHIVFGTVGKPRVYWARADGSGEASVLLEIPGQSNLLPNSFSPDGRTLVFTANSRDAGPHLRTVQLDLTDPDHPKAGTPQPLDQSPDPEAAGILSPDGHWLAYFAHPAGQRSEIYVQPFPPTGAKWKISEGIWAASAIAWARDLRELYYLGPDLRIMAASCTTKNGGFYADRARVWSQTRIEGSYPQAFDMSPDGKRAVVCLPAELKDQPAHLTFILNCFDELRRRAPASK